mgnify:CR=1 FL=1
MKSINQKYWGDDPRFFLGRVITGGDPAAMGRYKVRIFGIHDDNAKISNEDLPWAQCVIPATEPGVSGIGEVPQLSDNAFVYGMFLDGKNSQTPLIIGSIVTTQIPSMIQQTDPSSGSSFKSYGGITGSFIVGGPANENDFENISGNQEFMHDETILTDALNMPGTDIEEKIYNSLLEGGLSGAAVCGLMGNFRYESGPNASRSSTFDVYRGGPWNEAVNANDRGMPAFGLAQWRNDRWQSASYPGSGIVPWAERNGLSWRALSTQCKWVIWELNHKESSTGSKLSKVSNPADAAYIVCRYYERPQNGRFNWKGSAPAPMMNANNEVYCTALGATKPYRKSKSLEERINAAKGYYNKYVLGTSGYLSH